MKIKCSYCNCYFNDTSEKCPNCGAVNEGIVRTVSNQPQTIEELKLWYQERGLPPQETTRFFIGVNYTKPKAFGIYLDETTGNFIVYKNKASGERAIRYQGTDEAYAVNELYMRLKQEIIEQKMHQAKKENGTAGTASTSSSPQKEKGLGNRLIKKVLRYIAGIAGGILLFFAGLFLLGQILIFIEPKTGYYSYKNTVYYHCLKEYDGKSWYVYQGDWSEPKTEKEIPDIFQKKKTCKPYFIGKEWDKSINASDFEKSVWAKDLKEGIESETGYYQYGDKVYYHFSDLLYNWYRYDEEWVQLKQKDVPSDLIHSSSSKKYYQTNDYSASLNAADFQDSIYYSDYISKDTVNNGYFRAGNLVFYHMRSDYYSGWYEYDDDDDWYEISASDLPDDFKHATTVNDFYFTPQWDEYTQFTDFEDTSFYKEAQQKESDDDDDYDWGSNDSWDTNSTNWDSNW